MRIHVDGAMKIVQADYRSKTAEGGRRAKRIMKYPEPIKVEERKKLNSGMGTRNALDTKGNNYSTLVSSPDGTAESNAIVFDRKTTVPCRATTAANKSSVFGTIVSFKEKES